MLVLSQEIKSTTDSITKQYLLNDFRQTSVPRLPSQLEDWEITLLSKAIALRIYKKFALRGVSNVQS